MSTALLASQLAGNRRRAMKRVMLTPRQLIAARGLLGWTRADLAKRSGTSKDTVFAFEGRGSNPKLGTVQAWIGALHKAGVILLDEDDDHGPGVRLRKRR
jgi:transcriptional regulator with XRE-family HTH domain